MPTIIDLDKQPQAKSNSKIEIPSGSTIYVTKGQALEYAPLSTNGYRGCGHACRYCYVPLITKQDRKEFDAGAVPRKDYLIKLRRDASKLQARGITGQVMLSFLTDAYNPFDTSLTRPTLEILIEHGFDLVASGRPGGHFSNFVSNST
jgi:DNA repair photolyase